TSAIAMHLGITEAILRVQLRRVLDKIKVDNRTQAAVWALANLPEFATSVGTETATPSLR
ncbi:MAG TPA: LuxR C-terminal-related transcriptional regulator, partial [Stellaceae bacterium]